MTDTTLIHDPQTNVPDYAAEETARLKHDFVNLDSEVAEVLDAARGLPPAVENIDIANDYTKVITRMADLDKKIETFRVGEGTPWLRRKDAVDNFFFSLRERLFRRKKTDKIGGADVLQARLHDYNQRREREERERREAEARAAREAEDKARREREAAERTRREAEEKAARARKEENKEAAAKAAREAEEAAAALREKEEQERQRRLDAEDAARAKPADLVRERHEGGAMNTMRQVPFVEIEDEMTLDPLALWPFVKSDAKLAALKAWAKVTQHKKAMPGAIIEMRNETVVRR